MKRKILKLLLIIAIAFITLISIATAYVYYHEDEIYTLIIDGLNENQLGHTEVAYIDVSPFRNFPYVSIGLHNLRFYSDKLKAEEPIYAIQDIYAGFDLWDILRGEYTIKKLKLRDGYIRLVLDEDGNLNLSMTKSDGKETLEEEESSSPLHLDLQKVHIENIRLEEVNLKGNKYIDLLMQRIDANFSSIGNKIVIGFDGDLLLSEYSAESVTFFRDKSLSIDTDFEFNTETQWLTILPGKLTLDYGSLDFSGSIDFANQLTLDIEVYGRKKNFDAFISFAPNEVAEKLKRFRNEGDIYFKGKIFGPAIDAEPGIDLELGCENTFFFHNDKSKAIKDLAFKGRFHTGERNTLETAELVLSNLFGIPETGEFRGTIRVVNFLNPIVSVDFHADLDLENFQSFYDPDWLEGAGGNIRVDITINEFVDQDSVIHVASRLDDGTLSRIEFSDAWMKLTEYGHKLEKMNGKVVIDGDNLALEGLSCIVAQNDLSLSARLGNLNALAHHQDAPVDLTLHIESKKLDVASLLPAEMRNDTVPWKTEVLREFIADFDLKTNVESLYTFKHLPESEITIRNFKAQLEGFEQPLHRISGRIKTGDSQIDIDDLTVVIGQNDLHLSLLIDDPVLFFEREKSGAAHFHTKVVARRIDFKELLHYRGKSMVDPEIEEQLGDERIHDLHFECDGYIHPSTLSPNGVRAYCNLEKFTVQLNDLPRLEEARGKLRADTTGCLYIEDFYARLGRSDYHANLQLLHLLDTMGDKREIYGSISGNLWDFDEYFAKAPQTPAANQTELTQAEIHQPALNIFALPFPKMDLTLSVEKLINERYKLDDLYAHFRASPDHMLWIDSLSVRVAGGEIGIKGYLNGSNKNDLYLAGNISLKNVDLDQVFFKFDNFGQDYLVSEQVHGRVDGSISVKAHLYPDLTPMLDHTEARMFLKISDGRLENFAPMLAMSDFMGSKNLNNIRFAEMENTFDYRDGTLLVPKMKIASTLGYIHLSGKQDINDRLDYEIQVPLSLVKSAGWNMMKSKMSSGKTKPGKEELAALDEEIISEQKGLIRKYMTFKVTGTTDAFEIGIGKNKNLEMP